MCKTLSWRVQKKLPPPLEVESENPEDLKYQSEKASDEDVTHLTWPENIVKHKCNGKSDDQ